ncbi:MAG: transcriptional repressor [Clostridia bacterium]|nr:transcriptional repressor [Clostridia bacterium]
MKVSDGTKNSKQRTAILNVLQGTTSHPTANWIYDAVRKEIPNISLGTVYRNLAKLTEAGTIQRLDVGDGMDRFDANFHPHYHLFCNGCKRMMDLELPYDTDLDKMAAQIHGAEVACHNLIFYGRCGICLRLTKEKD